MTRRNIETIKFEKHIEYSPYKIQSYIISTFDVWATLELSPEKWCNYFNLVEKKLNFNTENTINNNDFIGFTIHFIGDIMNDTVEDIYLIIERENTTDATRINLNEEDKRLLLYAFINAYSNQHI